MTENEPTSAPDPDAAEQDPGSDRDEAYRRAVIEAAERGAEWSKELNRRLR